MRVLVTRPDDDARETAAKLEARGHQAIPAPLLAIRAVTGPSIALEGVQAVLVTSANGIRALAPRTARRDIAVLAVGAQSGEVARALGFRDVRDAGGDAAALAALARATLSPDKGPLFHAGGKDTRGGLAETLTAQGFRVLSEVLYEAVATTELPDAAAAALAARAVDAVLLFSPRTAKIFVDLVTAAGLAGACAPVTALAISDAAARELARLPFRDIRVAARPDQDALLALLG